MAFGKMKPQKGASIHLRREKPAVYTTVRASRRQFLLEKLTGRLISFFRTDAPVAVNRTKLAAGLVIGIAAPLVLVLSAVVFSNHRRYR